MLWNRKEAIAEQRKNDILDRMLKSTIGRQIAGELAEDRRAERQQLIDEIAETQVTIDRDGPTLQKQLRDAETELERAEKLAAAAREKRTMAVNAIASFSSRTDRTVLKAQAKLRATADPEIEQLVLEIDRTANAFRNRVVVEFRSGSESDPEATGPDQRVKVFTSRAAAINEQMAILEALRTECLELALAYAGDPAEALANIRQRMPRKDMSLTATHYTEQRPRVVAAHR